MLHAWDRSKSLYGQVKVDNAYITSEADQPAYIEFDIPNKVSADWHRGIAESCNEVDFGGFAQMNNKGSLSIEDILAYAKKSGPLFGYSKREKISSWAYASKVAGDAFMIQDFLNSKSSSALLESYLDKFKFCRVGTNEHFYQLQYVFCIGKQNDGYAEVIGEIPSLRRYYNDGSCDYCLIKVEEEGDELFCYLNYFVFREELCEADYFNLIRLFIDNNDDRTRLVKEMFGSKPPAGIEDSWLGSNSQFQVTQQELTSDDMPTIQNLVLALASLHMSGIGVDLFRSGNPQEYLVFETYLSYLWYSFVAEHTRVRVGYCEHCGRPFSLIGHRGIEKRFCSQQCKTAQKNKRAKHARDLARELFLDGKDLDCIAKKTYGSNNSANRKRAIRDIHGAKEVKREVARVIAGLSKKKWIVENAVNYGIYDLPYLQNLKKRIEADARFRKRLE